MGDYIVYSVDAGNTYTLEKRYTATIGKVKWWTGPDVAGYTNIIPSGPQRYEEIGEVLATLKRDNKKPFLVVQFVDQTQKFKYRSNKQIFFHGPTITQDVSIAGYNLIIRDSEDNDKAEYIPCGDETDMTITTLITSFFSAKERESNSYLFAHKSIMQLFPRQDFMGNNSYMANIMISPSNADSELYVNIGAYYDLAQLFPDKVPYSALPAILRCFVAYDNNLGYIGGRSKGVFIQGPGKKAFTNTAGSFYYNGSLCMTTDDAVTNILSCVLNKSGEHAITFQGLFLPNENKIFSERALRFMNGFCNSDYNPVPKYANACACLGRAGVENALRKELNNNMVRMVCQSTACLDGNRTGDVFTFVPTPPCAPINICTSGLDVNAAKVTMSNVTFNCNFDAKSGPSNTATGQDSAPAIAEPAGPTTMDSKTGTIIGASVGAVVFIILVIIIVVVVKRKRKQ